MAESFWGPAPIQEPTKSLFTRTKDTPITQKIPKGGGAQCQALLCQPRSSGGYKSFKGSVRNPEWRLYIYIYYFLMMPRGVCAGPCALERPPLCPLTHLTWSGPRGPPSPYHAPYSRSSPPKRPNPLWVRVGLPPGAFFWNVNYAMSWPSPRPEGKARGPLSAENVDGAWTDGRESHTHAQKPVRRSGRTPGGVGGARGEGQTGLPGPPYASAQHQKRRVPNSNFDGTITEV